MHKIIPLIMFAGMSLILVVGCQQNPHPMDMTLAVQSAKTKNDHEELASHYEQVAKDDEAKVAEHKKLLNDYKQRSYLYGREGESFLEHCDSLINFYQKAAETNLKMAKMHHQLAAVAK